jgi:hypothetical protein
MAIFFQNPYRACAAWMSSLAINNMIQIEPRYVGSWVSPEAMATYYQQKAWTPHITDVMKSDVLKKIVKFDHVYSTHFIESKSPTGYFAVDEQIVVSFPVDEGASPSFKMQAGKNFSSTSVTVHHYGRRPVKSPQQLMQGEIASVRALFLIWSQYFLRSFVGFVILGVISIVIISYQRQYFHPTILKVGLLADVIFTLLSCLRLYQWHELQTGWNLTVINLGGWAAYMRYLAFTYPDTINSHAIISDFLHDEELVFLDPEVQTTLEAEQQNRVDVKEAWIENMQEALSRSQTPT